MGLVTLADIKGYLDISGSDYDDFLEEQEEIIADAIEGFCGRKFAEATYTQTFYDSDYRDIVRELRMFHYPLIEVTEITEDDVSVDLTEFRIHYPSGTLIKPEYFFAGVEVVEVTYKAGYATIPSIIRNVVYSLIQEKYNKKISGVPLSFGSDVQRVSIPGVMSIDFDYTLEANLRKNAYGVILGSHVNTLDPFRSERMLIGSGKISYVT